MTNVYRVQDHFPPVLPCYVHVYLRRNGATQRALDPPISMNNQDNLTFLEHAIAQQIQFKVNLTLCLKYSYNLIIHTGRKFRKKYLKRLSGTNVCLFIVRPGPFHFLPKGKYFFSSI